MKCPKCGSTNVKREPMDIPRAQCQDCNRWGSIKGFTPKKEKK